MSRAVILRVNDFGESDRLVTFFTEDLGKLRGVAKHARRSRKRFGAGLECGSIGSARFFEKHGRDLVRLDEFVVERPAWRLTGSLGRIATLHIVLETVDRMLPLGHISRERFELLSRMIMFLSENEPLASHRHAFFYKWLAASGLEPVFDRCAACGKDISNMDGPYYIETRHGGLVCRQCHRARTDFIEVNSELLKYLCGFKIGKINGVAGDPGDRVFEYLLFHAIGGELRSLRIAKDCLFGPVGGIPAPASGQGSPAGLKTGAV